MNTVSHTPAPPRQHPDLEVLAAFVDGRLRNDERRRTVAHLAACELCREVVAETVHLSGDPALAAADGDPTDEDEDSTAAVGRVLRPPRERFRRALPLIGALVAAGLGALLIWTVMDRGFLTRDLAPVPVAALTAALDDAALRQGSGEIPRDSNDLGFPPSPRGDESELPGDLFPDAPQTPQQAFRLGVRVALLDAALRAGDVAASLDLTYHSGEYDDLSQQGLYGAKLGITAESAHGVRGVLKHDGNTARAAALLSEVDEILGGRLEDGIQPALDHPRWYELGKWTGAAWSAAYTGDLGWFDDAETKERLHALRQREWGGATDLALASVTGRAVSTPGEDDLPALQSALYGLTTAASNAPGARPVDDPDATTPTNAPPSEEGDAP